MIRTRFLVAALVVAAAACSSNDMASTQGTTTDNAVVSGDVAAAAADGVAEDVDVMTGMDGSIGNVSSGMNAVSNDDGMDDHPDGFHPGLLGCLLTGHFFNCPRMDDDGLMVDRTVTFMAADGSTETAFDPLLTASIHIVTDVSGDRTHGGFSATAARHRDFTITGLAGTETTRTVNGTSADTITRSRISHSDGTTRSYTFTANATVTDVVLPVNHHDGHNGFPQSGTVTRTFTAMATAGPDSGMTFTRTVTITFNGTSTVSGTVNGTAFTFDLVGHTDDDGHGHGDGDGGGH